MESGPTVRDPPAQPDPAIMASIKNANTIRDPRRGHDMIRILMSLPSANRKLQSGIPDLVHVVLLHGTGHYWIEILTLCLLYAALRRLYPAMHPVPMTPPAAMRYTACSHDATPTS
jgi:hypothetical protein